MCPLLWDVLGLPGSLDYIPDGFETVYFNRSDVKAALHAPDSVDWAECAVDAVFTAGDAGPESSGDLSADPIQSVLPKVIEKTNRVLVANGDYGESSDNSHHLPIPSNQTSDSSFVILSLGHQIDDFTNHPS